MKLELKHIAPYLPYGLQLYGASDIWVMHSLGVEEICIANGLHTQTLSFDDCLTNYSPMLRSLDTMTEKEKHELEFAFIQNPAATLLSDFDFVGFPIDIAMYEWLLANHFDIFGLIDAGLAVEKEVSHD